MSKDISKIVCKKCNKVFRFYLIMPKYPGAKSEENVCCPYCREINGSLMTTALVFSETLDQNDIKKPTS